mgnify:CR=1 FL=1
MLKSKLKIAAPILSLAVLLPLSTVGIASAVDSGNEANSGGSEIEVVDSKDVPFSTRVVEDDLMPKGVRIVIDDGEKGKQETVKIKEKGGLFSKDTIYEKTVISKPPSERVIRVGTNVNSTVDGVDKNVAEKETAKLKEKERKIREAEAKAVRELREKEEKERAERRAHLEQAAKDGSGVDINFGDIVGDIDVTANGVTTPEENREFLRSIVSQSEFRCADQLVMRESGYVTTATNPSSGAYGVAQSLPAEKYASQGADWQTNGKTQILWMQGYVDDRYGGWCNALDFHHANNWY